MIKLVYQLCVASERIENGVKTEREPTLQVPSKQYFSFIFSDSAQQ